MTFSDFARTFYPYCGNGCRTSDFVLSLVSNIMEEPASTMDARKAANDSYNPLAKLSISTLEKYFRGYRELSEKNASAILNRLDKDRFSDYINELPVDAVSLLGEALRSYGFVIADKEIPSRCADVFAEILEECANVQKNRYPMEKIPASYYLEASTEIVPDLTAQIDTIPRSELYLLMETSSYCPSCGKPLISKKNNDSLTQYKITNILPKLPTDEQKESLGELLDSLKDRNDQDNKIALCFDCANRYLSGTTREECANLLTIKERLHRYYNTFETLDRMYLEQEIEIVLRRISTASTEQLLDKLEYDALRVRDKISIHNMPLIINTEGFVVSYYKYIQSVFSQLEREGVLNFEDLANDVRHCYKKLNSSNLTQDEIYTQLANWFQNKTNAQSILVCEIIVAFFVQNCEVFDATAQ